jgi:hypothetical protein
MHARRLPTLFLALVLGFGLAARLYAASGQHGEPKLGIVSLGYDADRQYAAARSSVGGAADSTTIATLTSTTSGEIALLGKPNLGLEAVFSFNASQTCAVRVLWEFKDDAGVLKYTRWSASQSLAATAFPGPADTGFATAPGVKLDTGGATHARIVCVTAPTVGTVDFWAATY